MSAVRVSFVERPAVNLGGKRFVAIGFAREWRLDNSGKQHYPPADVASSPPFRKASIFERSVSTR